MSSTSSDSDSDSDSESSDSDSSDSGHKKKHKKKHKVRPRNSLPYELLGTARHRLTAARPIFQKKHKKHKKKHKVRPRNSLPHELLGTARHRLTAARPIFQKKHKKHKKEKKSKPDSAESMGAIKTGYGAYGIVRCGTPRTRNTAGAAATDCAKGARATGGSTPSTASQHARTLTGCLLALQGAGCLQLVERVPRLAV
eukprot:SAG22_NODE_1489_length_4310_cov_7.945856_1_plen_198_part_00